MAKIVSVAQEPALQRVALRGWRGRRRQTNGDVAEPPSQFSAWLLLLGRDQIFSRMSRHLDFDPWSHL